METIHATTLQRSTRKVLDEVFYSGRAYEVKRHGDLVAFLVPAAQFLPLGFEEALKGATAEEVIRLIFDDQDPREVTP